MQCGRRSWAYCLRLCLQRLAGLQQRLEVAQDVCPASACAWVVALHKVGVDGRTGQVMCDRQPRHSVIALWLDLEGEPRERLLGHALVEEHPPGLNQLVWRIYLDDLAL